MPIPALIELPKSTDFPGWLRVRTPYKAEFVTAIKLLPRYARSFDPDSKCWLVSQSFLEEVKELCEEFYGEVEVLDGPKPKAKPRKGTRYLGGDADCEHEWVKPWKMAVVERCEKCGQWEAPPLRVTGEKVS